MHSRNDPNYFGHLSLNSQSQSEFDGTSRPSSQRNPFAQHNPNTRAFARATNQQPFQQNSQIDYQSSW